MDSISLDQAASTPLRAAVLEEMLPWLTNGANPSGAHRLAQQARAAVEAAREELAELLRCQPREVVFTSGGTESDNLAVSGTLTHWVGVDQTTSSGVPPNIAVSAFEHKAVLATAERWADRVEVRTILPDREGQISEAAVVEQIDANTIFVSVMTVNNELGTVQPVRDIARAVRRTRQGKVFHTDAIQAPLWIDVGAATELAHLVSISAHKFGGPKGIGCLVVRDTQLDPLLVGGGQEFGLRGGTLNVAGIVGMAAALRVTHDERAATIARVGDLRERLLRALMEGVPGLRPTVPTGTAGHLHITIPGVDGELALIALDRAGIAVSAGASCASGALDPSHVLRAIGLPASELRNTLRLSLSFATTEAMIDDLVAVMPGVLRPLQVST